MTLSDRDMVRLRIGDTDPNAPLLNDEELDALIDANAGDTWLAAADACDAIAAQYASKFDFSTDNQSFSPSQVVAQYRELAGHLRTQSAAGGVGNAVTIRIDGYSDDIDNRTTTADSGKRRPFGLWGHPDRVP